MAEVTVTLRGKTAEKLLRMVEEQQYSGVEEAIADALEANEPFDDPELEAWLQGEVAARLKAYEDGEDPGITTKELRARLFGKA
jgi:hypothetical protein